MAASHRETLSNLADRTGFNAVRFVLDRLPRADRQPGPTRLHEVSPSARQRWREAADRLPEGTHYRPATLGALSADLDCLPIPPETATGPSAIHLVEDGETLQSIARSHYGAPELADAVWRANSDKLAPGQCLYRGQALRLPEILE